MPRYSSKNTLMNILEKLNDNKNNKRVASPNEDQLQAAIVDGPGWQKLSHLTSQSGSKIAHSKLNTLATVLCRHTLEIMKSV